MHDERVVPFTTGDGITCNVINVRGATAPSKPPVLLVHGAGCARTSSALRAAARSSTR